MTELMAIMKKFKMKILLCANMTVEKRNYLSNAFSEILNILTFTQGSSVAIHTSASVLIYPITAGCTICTRVGVALVNVF